MSDDEVAEALPDGYSASDLSYAVVSAGVVGAYLDSGDEDSDEEDYYLTDSSGNILNFCVDDSVSADEAYDALLAFCRKHLPDKFFVEGVQSISLRDLLARELISNTLMHREYSSPFPAKLVIDGRGLRTENASRPRIVGALAPGRFNPLSKNPIIAEFFANIGLADALGSGTRNLFKYSWAYGGGRPTLVDGDVFEAVVPLAPVEGAVP